MEISCLIVCSYGSTFFVPSLMSTKSMGKVQTYGNLASYFSKAEPFLFEDEFKNNLFWELAKVSRTRGNPTWAGNVFLHGKLSISSLITPSGYLLISEGAGEAIIRLAKYGKTKKWKIKGVTGSQESVGFFIREWLGETGTLPAERKDFMIYSVPCDKVFKAFPEPTLEVVKSESWPRIQTWTTLFANESSPPVNANALLTISREMMKRGNLFLVRKEGVGACAMGGFGRSTPNSLVINEVFVPKELRGMGYGSELISGLIGEARRRKFSKCILFSDFFGPKNLYERLGFEKVVPFCEQSLG